MSNLTQLLRSNPVTSGLLDDVEGVEKSAVPAVVHVAVPVVTTLIQGAANTALTTALGAGAAIAEPQVDALLADFTVWLSSKL